MKLLALLFAILSAPFSFGGTALTLSAETVPVDSTDNLVHTISGLANGETVLVERIADLNGNGAADAGEPSFRTFRVTDGLQPVIGGVVNRNVPGDDDGVANGTIRVDLFFPGIDPILNRSVGKFVVRVSGPSGVATRPLQVTPIVTQNPISGVVRGPGGTPRPYAMVVVLNAATDGMPMGSVLTDANGAFQVNVPGGAYLLAPVSDGFVASPQFVSLPGNAPVTQDLSMMAGTVRVSGRVREAGGGVGLPGVFVLAQSGGDSEFVAGGLTDGDGNYTFSVAPGMWEVRTQSEMTAQLGYVQPESGPIIEALSAPITQNFDLVKANALIYGRFQDQNSVPIGNAPLAARLWQLDEIEAGGRTRSNGDYFLGVSAATWEVQLSEEVTGFRRESRQVTVSAGQARREDFTLQRANASVFGRVVDSNGTGIPGLYFHGHFNNSFDTAASQTTGPDGSFDFQVWDGDWYFHIGDDAFDRGLIDHYDRRTIAANSRVEIVFVVPTVNKSAISGVVRNSSSQPIGGVELTARAVINGVDYESGATTSAEGSYSLPVINGTWNVSFHCQDLEDQNYQCPSTSSVVINNANRTLDFVIQPMRVTAFINGVVLGPDGNPRSGVQIGAGGAGGFRMTTSNENGQFSIPVYAGQWFLQLSGNPPAGTLGPNISFNIADGVNVNNVQYRLKAADATVTGSIKSSSGAPVAGIYVYSFATIEGMNYSIPFATSNGQGEFSFPVIRGSWTVSLDCSKLLEAGFNCAAPIFADTTAGNARADFVVNSGQAPAPELTSGRMDRTGASPMFEFRLVGEPGFYEIQGTQDLPFGGQSVGGVTIATGQNNVLVRLDASLGRFFRVVRR